MNLIDVPNEIVTDRLSLLVSSPDFADAFAEAMLASYDDLRFVAGWRKAVSEEVARESLLRSIELADQDVVRHAFERSSGRYVGRLDLHSWDSGAPRCELGYVADSRMTGRGLMHEAAGAMLDVAWSLGARRVQALCDSRNIRSIRFAERLGFRLEGVLRSFDRDDEGQLYDEVVLAIVRPDTSMDP
ncbi:MAG: GNAT family protein [Actinomycetes bacterium]